MCGEEIRKFARKIEEIVFANFIIRTILVVEFVEI